MRGRWTPRLPFTVLRQVYGRLGAIAWLVAVTAGVVVIIAIALWAKTPPVGAGVVGIVLGTYVETMMDWLTRSWRGKKYWRVRFTLTVVLFLILVIGVETMHGEAAFWVTLIGLLAANLPFFLDDRRVDRERRERAQRG